MVTSMKVVSKMTMQFQTLKNEWVKTCPRNISSSADFNYNSYCIYWIHISVTVNECQIPAWVQDLNLVKVQGMNILSFVM